MKVAPLDRKSNQTTFHTALVREKIYMELECSSKSPEQTQLKLLRPAGKKNHTIWGTFMESEENRPNGYVPQGLSIISLF
jgi:hypothetical protein